MKIPKEKIIGLLFLSIYTLLLIQTIFSISIEDLFINIGILILTSLLGVFLIRHISKESNQKEKLKTITSELETANNELKRIDMAKSEFLSIVSHQLRTPLTAIKGYVSMALEGSYGKLQETQKSALEKVFQSTEHLIILVSDLLNLNRAEEGHINFLFSPVDLAEMVDEAIFEFKIMAENKNLKLSWIKPHGLPMAWADESKIRQVVVNFIYNSIKYTAQGSINITLRLENDYLVYQVKDTGIGMTEEDKNKLFKKFERGEGGKLMYAEGTGLGLYVAKLMTEAHKGTIKGESEGKNRGSVFSIRIPTEEYAKKNNINQKPINIIK